MIRLFVWGSLEIISRLRLINVQMGRKGTGQDRAMRLFFTRPIPPHQGTPPRKNWSLERLRRLRGVELRIEPWLNHTRFLEKTIWLLCLSTMCWTSPRSLPRLGRTVRNSRQVQPIPLLPYMLKANWIFTRCQEIGYSSQDLHQKGLLSYLSKMKLVGL